MAANTGGGGDVLAELQQCRYPQSLPDLAKKTGHSRSALSGELDNAVESGLVERGNAYGYTQFQINRSHPLYPNFERILFIVHGVAAPPKFPGLHRLPADGDPYAVPDDEFLHR
ncbi:MarR family transcriptional regulator [Aldersonia sp. NBC_00410]|uniref:MarR family transcriptional regulator n=1 Tax=Aldersonia sp. NBC_00410 TaxID=2975954 RepID=UPI0022594666|nr:helix-turn-helix domain-containing protein [Aldersonia sp. NBC_00410]MCX5046238.1 MarR family transcriptional regulator [Aldersonia sp. NBC_00410]